MANGRGTGVTTNPQAVGDIVARIASGEGPKSIAESYGVTRNQIQYVAKPLRKKIEEIRKRMQEKRTRQMLGRAFKVAKRDIEVEEVITERILGKVRDGEDVAQSEIAVKNAFSETKRKVLEADGVFPSKVSIGKQYNQYNNQYNNRIDPNILKVLTQIPSIEMMPMVEAEADDEKVSSMEVE